MPAKLPLIIALLCVSALPIRAQSAPIPAELTTAKSVFISNGGGEYNSRATQAASARYTGGSDRPYNEFYSAMQTWGHYALASTPASADLSMEIRFAIEVVPDFNFQHAYDAWDPTLRVVVRDIKTQTVLWTVTEHVQGLQDKDFDAAMGQMMNDLKKLAAAT